MPQAPETQSAPEAQVAEVVCPCLEEDSWHPKMCNSCTAKIADTGGSHDSSCDCHGTGKLYPWLWKKCPGLPNQWPDTSKHHLDCHVSYRWKDVVEGTYCSGTGWVANVDEGGLLRAAKEALGAFALRYYPDQGWVITRGDDELSDWYDTPKEAVAAAILQAREAADAQ